MRLQQSAGNAALGRVLARSELADWFDTAFDAVGDVSSKLANTTIEEPVGTGGANAPTDVLVVVTRLSGLGYTEQPLSAAITHYQREAVGFDQPDGRVDPEGTTLKALRAGLGGVGPATPTPTPTPSPAAPGGGSAPSLGGLVLTGAVGPGKANLPDDVAAVRARLAELAIPPARAKMSCSRRSGHSRPARSGPRTRRRWTASLLPEASPTTP